MYDNKRILQEEHLKLQFVALLEIALGRIYPPLISSPLTDIRLIEPANLFLPD